MKKTKVKPTSSVEEEVIKREIKPSFNRNDQNQQWWSYEDSEEASRSAFQLADRIEQLQRTLLRTSLTWAQLYENIETFGVSYTYLQPTFATLPSSSNTVGTRLTYNVVKSCIDSVTAKIAKSKPRIKLLTTKGDYRQQQRAQKLTQYLDGLFYESDLYSISQKVFKDSCIFGTGYLKVYVNEDQKIKVERVLPIEMLVDPLEATYQNPRQLHQKKNANRDSIRSNFPDKEKEIDDAPTIPTATLGTADQILVTESWHLPSRKGAKDGRHLISIENACLLDEEYTYSWFPFCVLRWSDRVTGWHGMGLCEELAPIQRNINNLLNNIAVAQEMMSIPRIFCEVGSVVSKNQLFEAGIIEYSGLQPPQFTTPQAMPQEIYQYLETQFQKAYEVTGVSQLSATATKPAGLNSGVALREYQDSCSERFALQGLKFEQMFVELANKMISISKELYKNNSALSLTKIDGDKFIRTIKWEEVDMEDDQYVLQCFPVSSLPETPAGRLDYVQELSNSGLIPQDDVAGLLNFPELDNIHSVYNASVERTMEILDKIVEDGEYTQPDPLMNLNKAQNMATAYYLKYSSTDIEEERLDLLRQFIDKCVELLNPSDLPQPSILDSTEAPPPPPPGPEAGPVIGTPPAPPPAPMAPFPTVQ